MNSPEPSGMGQGPSVRARPAFNWIELLVVPIVSSIMESQLLILALMLVVLFFAQTSDIWPLDEVTITLLLLGLHWWAIFVRGRKARAQGNENEGQTRLLHLLGLLLALALLLGTHSALFQDIPMLFLSVVLVIWCWWRGMDRSRSEQGEERLIMTFKIGFIGMMIVLAFSVISSDPSTVLPMFVPALPLFFFSGLVALSLGRLVSIERENGQHPGATQTAAVRKWFVVLMMVWGGTVAMATALEVFSFQVIQRILQPFWDILGTVADWILFVLSFLLSGLNGLFRTPSAPPPHALPAKAAPPPGHAHLRPPAAISAEELLIVRLILLIIVAVILVLVIRMILKAWHPRAGDESEEEIREGLSAWAILQARRQEHNQQKAMLSDLEALDPASARALYREFLQAMALHSDDLRRRPAETPGEYQARLSTIIEQQGVPTDAAFLHELGGAYIQERYQGTPIGGQKHAHLKDWLAAFTQRLRG